MKRCPFCAEEIQDEAVICRFCNRPQAPLEPSRRVALRLISAGDRQEDVVALLSRLTGLPDSWARDIVAESFRRPTVAVADTSARQAQDAIDRIAAVGGTADMVSREKAKATSAQAVSGGTSPTTRGSAVLMALGGAMVVIGSFLPWASASAPLVGTVSVTGLQGGGDGVWTLILGLVIVALATVSYTGRSETDAGILAISIVVGVLMLADLPGIGDRVRQAQAASALINASIGAGVFAVLIGAVAAIAGALVAMGAKRQRSRTRPVRADHDGETPDHV